MTLMNKRIIFLGSPDFTVPVLARLNQKYSVFTVITQPDRPSGRGGKIVFSAVKELSLALGLTVLQPERIKESSFIGKLNELKPDLMVVAAYGQILSKSILDLPPFGCINVHASLLPRWRGASPIQSSILAGDAKSGVSIMKMDEGLDTGPILSQQEVTISVEDSAFSLSKKLAEAGAELLLNTLDGYFSGSIKPIKQEEEKVTRTKLIKKGDGILDFNKSASYLERMVRAYYPWPGAFFYWNDIPIKVLQAHVDDFQTPLAGDHIIINKKPAFGTEKGYLVLDLIQPAGKKPMTGEEYLNGVRNWVSA
jgi:methionyl-tRNA formyltransferase